MSKSIVAEVKEAVKNKKKEENKMNKSNVVDTIKNIVITALVVGIAAFICGVHYQQQNMQAIDNKVKELTVTSSVDAPVKK